MLSAMFDPLSRCINLRLASSARKAAKRCLRAKRYWMSDIEMEDCVRLQCTLLLPSMAQIFARMRACRALQSQLSQVRRLNARGVVAPASSLEHQQMFVPFDNIAELLIPFLQDSHYQTIIVHCSFPTYMPSSSTNVIGKMQERVIKIIRGDLALRTKLWADGGRRK
jgi:hypothetical protein